ncbi:unnamed protein product [Camellia sinensis]
MSFRCESNLNCALQRCFRSYSFMFATSLTMSKMYSKLLVCLSGRLCARAKNVGFQKFDLPAKVLEVGILRSSELS